MINNVITFLILNYICGYSLFYTLKFTPVLGGTGTCVNGVTGVGVGQSRITVEITKD